MKVAIPTMGNNGLDEQVGEHFGRVPTYTLIDTETNEVRVVSNTSEHMGGQGYPPDLLARLGVEVMLCSGLGHRAIQMFEQLGISVYIGASGTVKEVLNFWKNNQLQMATQETACQQHAFRKEEHHHP